MTDSFNQVYQGREGPGAAFVLNGNRAADLFQQKIQADEQNRRLTEFNRQKADRERNILIDANMGKVNLKDHWIAQDDELRGKYKQLMDYGAQLKIKGINPTADISFRDMNNKLDAEATYSGQLATGFAAYQKEISEKGDNYSDESKQALAAYYDPKKSLTKYMQEGMVPPTLKPKYTLSGMLKGIKGSSAEFDANGRIVKQADRGKNVQTAEGLQDTPAFKNFVKEQGGDPNMPAFPTRQNGKTIYSVNDAVLAPMVDKYLNDIKPEEYKNFGLKSATKEEAGIELLNIIKRQNKAYGTVIATAADQLDAGIDGSNRKDWAGDASARGWAGYNLRKQSEARQAAKDSTPDQDSTYRQNWINDMFDGVAGSGEKLKAAVKGNLDYDGDLRIERIKSQPSKIVLRIPKQVDGKAANTVIAGIMGAGGRSKDGRTITLDKNNADDKIILNKIISELTDENVNISQLMTPGGKKKVAGGKGSDEISQPSNDPLNLDL